MLTRQRLRDEVEKVERQFVGDLPSIRRRAFLLAVAAYAYLIGAVLLCALVGLGALWLILLVPSGVTFGLFGTVAFVAFGLGFSLVRASFVPVGDLPGIALERRDAPRLFDVIDELAAKYDGVDIDGVRIDEDFNAAVAQIPRFGLLGGYRTTLLLGLPLLQTHTPSDLRAVIAHELGHAAHRDGQAGVWAFRTWTTWEHLQATLDPGQRGVFVLAPIARWLWPKFNAYAIVAMREAETRADRASLRVSSSAEAATALSRIATWNGWLSERFWPDLWGRVGDEPEPPAAVFDELVARASLGISSEERQRYFREALQTAPESWDTHPTYAARLATLGHPTDADTAAPELPTVDISHSAAVAYLGDSYPGLVKVASDAWCEATRVEWVDAHQQIQHWRRDLPADSEIVRAEDAWRRAQIALMTWADDSVAWLERTLELSPKHSDARMCLGQKLLEDDPSRGLEMLESLIVDQPYWAEAALEAIRSFHSMRGDGDALEALDRRLDADQEERRLSSIERVSFERGDEFLPHDAPAALVEKICEVVSAERAILRAYLARKRIRHLSSVPAYVLCLETETRWYKLAPNRRDDEIIGRIFESLPEDASSFLIFVNRDDYRSPGQKVIRAAAEPIYARGD